VDSCFNPGTLIRLAATPANDQSRYRQCFRTVWKLEQQFGHLAGGMRRCITVPAGIDTRLEVAILQKDRSDDVGKSLFDQSERLKIMGPEWAEVLSIEQEIPDVAISACDSSILRSRRPTFKPGQFNMLYLRLRRGCDIDSSDTADGALIAIPYASSACYAAPQAIAAGDQVGVRGHSALLAGRTARGRPLHFLRRYRLPPLRPASSYRPSPREVRESDPPLWGADAVELMYTREYEQCSGLVLRLSDR